MMVVVGPDGMVVGGLLGGVQTRGVVTLMGSGRLSSYLRVSTTLEKSKPLRRCTHLSDGGSEMAISLETASTKTNLLCSVWALAERF